jgi:hypothetical protein
MHVRTQTVWGLALGVLIALGMAAPVAAQEVGGYDNGPGSIDPGYDLDEDPPMAVDDSDLGPQPIPTDYREDEGDDSRAHTWFGGRGGIWFLGIEDTTIRTGADGLAGTKLDLSADLDIDDGFAVGYAEAHIRTKYVSVFADIFHFDEEASSTLSADVSFGGETFSASTPVRADVEALSVGGRIELKPLVFDSWELALLLGGRYYKLSAELKSAQPGVAVGTDETVEGGVPFVGAALRLYPTTWAELYAQGQGFFYESGDDEVTYAEVEAGAALRIFGDRVAVVGAYRWFLADIDYDGDLWDASWHGPALFLRLQI